jgi:hypothetical protein
VCADVVDKKKAGQALALGGLSAGESALRNPHRASQASTAFITAYGSDWLLAPDLGLVAKIVEASPCVPTRGDGLCIIQQFRRNHVSKWEKIP